MFFCIFAGVTDYKSSWVDIRMRRQNQYLFLLYTVLILFCGTVEVKAQDETIVFTPQWTAQAQFAGYYVAEAKGFYREAGGEDAD